MVNWLLTFLIPDRKKKSCLYISPRHPCNHHLVSLSLRCCFVLVGTRESGTWRSCAATDYCNTAATPIYSSATIATFFPINAPLRELCHLSILSDETLEVRMWKDTRLGPGTLAKTQCYTGVTSLLSSSNGTQAMVPVVAHYTST